jgi:FkbM family methyltransferase
MLRGATLDVTRYTPATHPLARRKRLLDVHGIDVVFDIGANVGQYATELRDLGYAGWIVSYEPLSSAYRELEQRAARDDKWRLVRAGLGPRDGELTLNIAGNSQSSSVLPMLDAHARAAPESKYVGTETIRVQTLARALAEHAVGSRPFVKLDVQGYERTILDAAPLEQVVGIQLEMSIVPLYQGEATMTEMIAFLTSRGFALASLEPGYSDPETARLLQVDGIFFNS